MFTPPSGPPLQAVVATGHTRTNSTQIINIALYNEAGDPMTAVTSEDMTEFVTNDSLATTLEDYTPTATLTTELAAKLTATQVAAQVDSVATTAPGIVTDFNALLAKLRASGVLHA